MTSEWIASQGGQEEKLKYIQDILNLAEGHAEWVNDMVMEAWAVLVEKKLWQVKYATKQDALAAIDSALLRDIQKRAGSSRDRKAKFTAEIRASWKDLAEGRKFSRLGEHYLAYVAAVSRVYTYSEASRIIPHIALRRIEAGRGG